MTRSWIAAVTAGLVVSFAACSNSEQSRSQNPQSARESDNPTVTLTGCLTPGSDSNEFVLQNVRASNDDRTVGGVTATSYVVIAASSDIDLLKQLNHQVEVKGRPSTAASETLPPNQRTETRAELSRPRLVVSDIKSIADKCTAPTP